MNTQVLGKPYKTKTDAVKYISILFPNAVKVGVNKWQNGTSQIWIDTNNQIVINYGK